MQRSCRACGSITFCGRSVARTAGDIAATAFGMPLSSQQSLIAVKMPMLVLFLRQQRVSLAGTYVLPALAPQICHLYWPVRAARPRLVQGGHLQQIDLQESSLTTSVQPRCAPTATPFWLAMCMAISTHASHMHLPSGIMYTALKLAVSTDLQSIRCNKRDVRKDHSCSGEANFT